MLAKTLRKNNSIAIARIKKCKVPKQNFFFTVEALWERTGCKYKASDIDLCEYPKELVEWTESII